MAKKTKSYLEINEFEPISNTTDEVEFEPIFKNESTNSDEEEMVINYDGLWKLIIETFYLDFMEFFLPDLFAKLDTSVAPEFLDQELLTIQKELNIPKQITDKLIKVRLLDGTEKWILIHIEVQTKFEIYFSARMYLYQAFIYAKYRLPIVALAVFTTAHTPKYYNVYKVEQFGTKSYYHYNAYKIAKQDEAALIASPNIFALFVLAHLYVIKTTPKKYEDRVLFKEKLFILAEQKQIPQEKIQKMLMFVDEIIALPTKFQISFMKTRNVPSRSESELAAIAALERSTIALAPSLFRAFAAREGMTYEAYVALQAQKLEADMKKAENLMMRAKAETKQVEEAKKELKEAKKQAEAEKKQAEAEKKQAEAEKKQAEAEKLYQRIYLVIALHEQANFDASKIASIQQMEAAEVAFIWGMHQQKKLSIQEIIPLLKAYQQQIK